MIEGKFAELFRANVRRFWAGISQRDNLSWGEYPGNCLGECLYLRAGIQLSACCGNSPWLTQTQVLDCYV